MPSNLTLHQPQRTHRMQRFPWWMIPVGGVTVAGDVLGRNCLDRAASQATVGSRGLFQVQRGWL